MTVLVSPLAPDLLDPAFDLATRAFVDASTLHRALGIGLAEYRAYLRPSFEAMAAQDLSVAATDARTGELAGCLLVTDYRRQPGAACPSSLAPLAALVAALRRSYERRGAPAPGEAILVDMAAVAEGARGRGVYRRMRAAAEARAASRGFRRVVGEASSAATQHVLLERLGHRRRAEIAYRGFAFGGGHPFASIARPPSIVLAEGDLR